MCHVPPRYTDSVLGTSTFVLHDIGTWTPASGNRLGGPLVGFDTPSLLGVWATAPYLHDGSAATIAEVLVRPGSLKARLTAGLDASALADLAEFLLELDGRPEPEVPLEIRKPPVTCGCSAAGIFQGFFVVLLLRGRKKVRS